jgi:acyl dehydratase
MAISNRHILSHGPALLALGRTVLGALRPPRAPGTPVVPGPEVHARVPAPRADLVRDYVRHVGGEPSAWRGVLPPHLFPQWSFGIAARALEGAPYSLLRVVNGGCRIESHAPLPAGEPLDVRARLESIEDDGRRAVLRVRVATGTPMAPDALVATMVTIVPLRTGPATGPAAQQKFPAPLLRARARVPETAREIARLRLGPRAGLDFAKLTGDFNPIHWIPAAARAQGFRGPILHGFGTLARAYEAVGRGVCAGDVGRIASFDVRFTRPLVLPAVVGVYVDGAGGVFVGDAPGGPAYLTGSYTLRGQR